MEAIILQAKVRCEEKQMYS